MVAVVIPSVDNEISSEVDNESALGNNETHTDEVSR